MGVLKALLMLVAVIATPLIAFFVMRLLLKVNRTITHINRTLDDARPQINSILVNMNRTVEDVNGELDKIGRLTDEAQDMLQRSEKSLSAVENAINSPLARYAGTLASFFTAAFLVRGIFRRSEKVARKLKR